METITEHQLIFGWRTVLLLVVQLHLLTAAVLLFRRSPDRSANRLLAFFLLVIIGILTPQMIGFAGFYDAYPWLSFAPFSNELLVGPLIYAYVRVLTQGIISGRFWLMLIPGCIGFIYSFYWFIQPLTDKWAWVDGMHDTYIAPLINIMAIAMTATGITLGFRHYHHYQRWLAQHSSASADFSARWLPACLVLILGLLIAWIGKDLIELITGPLNYFQEFPFYILLAVVSYGLAQGALMLPRQQFPKMPTQALEAVHELITEAEYPDKHALADQAARIRQRIVDEQWHLDSQLALGDLAHRLASNESYISRTINLGAGVNFSRFINELRVDTAKQLLLSSNSDILTIALDSGFNSKATFNRVFRDIVDMTPSAYRAQSQHSVNAI